MVAAGGRHRFHRDLGRAPRARASADCRTTVLPSRRRPERSRRSGSSTTCAATRWRSTWTPTLHGVSEKDRHRPPLVIHLHGAPNRPEHDGFPTSPFRLGRGVDYRFTNPPHAQSTLVPRPFDGDDPAEHLCGPERALPRPRPVRDTGTRDNPLDLPAGGYETALVISDELFLPDGKMRYDNTWTVPTGHWAGGLAGDTMVVNGKVWPRMPVDWGCNRFRILVRQLTQRLPPVTVGRFDVLGHRQRRRAVGCPLLVNGSASTSPPHERYDILGRLLRYRPGQKVQLVNSMRISMSGQMNGALVVRPVMRFDVGSRTGRYQRVPDRLRGGCWLVRPIAAAPHRPRQPPDRHPQCDGQPAQPVLAGCAQHEPQRSWTGPPKTFEHPVQGTTECWDIVNPDATIAVALPSTFISCNTVSWAAGISTQVRYLAENPPPVLSTRWTPDPTDYLTSEMFNPAPTSSA